MKIMILTDFFPPEQNAPANRMFQFSKEWISQGHEVTVITSFPNSPNGKLFPPYKKPAILKFEELDGIKIIRVWTYMAANKGFIKRTLDHISYAFSSVCIGTLQKKQDLIIATSPQFFTAIAGYVIAKLRNTKWIFEVRDIWPQGMIIINDQSYTYKALESIEKFLYKKADKIVVVTKSFKEDIIERCNIDEKKISVVFNGSSFSSSVKEKNLVSKKVSAEELTIGYAGTIGVSQGFEFLINEINNLKDKPFNFRFIGDGAMKEYIDKKKLDLSLLKLSTSPAVSRIEISNIIKSFDIGIVPLKKFEPYKKVIPSKMFDLAALGVPILLGVEGESAGILEDYLAGEAYLPEDSKSFNEALKRMKVNLSENPFYYAEGLSKLENDFNHRQLAANYEIILEKL